MYAGSRMSPERPATSRMNCRCSSLGTPYAGPFHWSWMIRSATAPGAGRSCTASRDDLVDDCREGGDIVTHGKGVDPRSDPERTRAENAAGSRPTGTACKRNGIETGREPSAALVELLTHLLHSVDVSQGPEPVGSTLWNHVWPFATGSQGLRSFAHQRISLGILLDSNEAQLGVNHAIQEHIAYQRSGRLSVGCSQEQNGAHA